VHARIIVLALITVAGFLANGLRHNRRSTELGDTIAVGDTIAEGVSRASGEARVEAEAMSRVAGVTTDARSTASGIKDLAHSVAVEAKDLEAQVHQFLNKPSIARTGLQSPRQ
jgi:hypothetical protein